VPALPRPVVLLEDGAGRSGRARLAWGPGRRFRLDWSRADTGRLAWLGTLPRDTRVYGALAYDLGLPPKARRAEPLVAQPLADLFEPAGEVVVDLERDVVAEGELPGLGGWAVGRVGGWENGPAMLPPYRLTALPPEFLGRSFDQPAFESAVMTIKEHIAAGDVYQVNLAVAERFAVAESPWEVYLRLRRINPSPWMGFMDFGDWQLVSGSPELLVELSSGENDPRPPNRPTAQPSVRTRPIAGTRKKTGDAAVDAAMRAELALDEKEQAEHRMLLDLARNDLGRVCEYGTVCVSEREVIEEYSHVFHLVSEVVGRVRLGCEPWEVIGALFPGGTITGAPKIRAMELIADLEPVARGAYTGGLGWIGPGAAQFNILIRSAVFREGVACVQAGAGIVWDSDPAREWRESLRKASAMRLALGFAE